MIRELIKRNVEELERYGGLPCHTANPSPQGGRPSEEYYLNEEQALLICMKSDAPRAADAREEIIAVFQAWRHGKLVPAQPVTIDEVFFAKNKLSGYMHITRRAVCQVLEHSNATLLAGNLDPDEKGLSIVETLGGPQEMAIISEPGLYKLIQTSRKPAAKRSPLTPAGARIRRRRYPLPERPPIRRPPSDLRRLGKWPSALCG